VRVDLGILSKKPLSSIGVVTQFLGGESIRNICVYICAYIYIYAYMYMYMYMYVYVCICMYIYIHKYVYIYKHINIYITFTHKHIYNISIYVYTHLHTQIYVYTHTSIYAPRNFLRIPIFTSRFAGANMAYKVLTIHIYILSNTHTYVHISIFVHTSIYVYAYANILRIFTSTHRLAGAKMTDKVLIFQHLFDREGQGDGHGKGQTLRHGYYKNSDACDEESQQLRPVYLYIYVYTYIYIYVYVYTHIHICIVHTYVICMSL